MIHLVTGMQGSGKTLFLVKKSYEAYKKGKTIYSNIALKFPYKKISYDDIVNCKYENALVIIDEVHILLPARRSMSKKSVQIVDGFLSMVRKKDLDVYGTTQTLRKVDVRFREEADYIYTCEKYATINGSTVKVLHNQNLDIGIPIIIKMRILQTFSGCEITLVFNGNPYFKLYDTKQIIEVKFNDKPN